MRTRIRLPGLLLALVMLVLVGMPAGVAAETNPLLDALKSKGIITDEEAGKLEQQLDQYYQKKMAPKAEAPKAQPAVAVEPAQATAPPPATPGKEPAPVAAEATPPKAPTVEERLAKLEEERKKRKVRWGGEARFRIMREDADAPTSGDGVIGGDWAGLRASTSNPLSGPSTISFTKAINTNAAGVAQGRNDNDTSFPTRLRLNWEADVIPDWVNVYGRFTINKRWGTYSTYPEQDPFNAPNSFHSSIGSELAPRAEQVYMTMKVPHIPWDLTWYVGRLPGMDGAPSRQDRSIFPRLFIDSEIDGTLLRVAVPKTPLSEGVLPWEECPVEALNSGKFRGGPMSQIEKKQADENAVFLGYLMYNETKLTNPSGKGSVVSNFVPIIGEGQNSDVFVAQAQFKLSRGTELILNGLYMENWYMPRQDFSPQGAPVQAINPVFNPVGGTGSTGSWTNGLDIPFFTSEYALFGGYFDTQLLGFQVYGSLYFNHLDVPPFSYQLLLPDGDGGNVRSNTINYEGHDFLGRIWHVGVNTGTWLAKWNSQLCIEYASGSDEWINPFNYRGYRRKGTVLFPEKNSFFGGNQTVGFYPFAANIWDAYFDYYWKRVRFRTGVMWFDHKRHDLVDWSGTASGADTDNLTNSGGADRIFGWSRYQTHWWPYFDINLSF